MKITSGDVMTRVPVKENVALILRLVDLTYNFECDWLI